MNSGENISTPVFESREQLDGYLEDHGWRYHGEGGLVDGQSVPPGFADQISQLLSERVDKYDVPGWYIHNGIIEPPEIGWRLWEAFKHDRVQGTLHQIDHQERE